MNFLTKSCCPKGISVMIMPFANCSKLCKMRYSFSKKIDIFRPDLQLGNPDQSVVYYKVVSIFDKPIQIVFWCLVPMAQWWHWTRFQKFVGEICLILGWWQSFSILWVVLVELTVVVIVLGTSVLFFTEMRLQRLIKNPVKHLKWSVFAKARIVTGSRKTFHLRC